MKERRRNLDSERVFWKNVRRIMRLKGFLESDRIYYSEKGRISRRAWLSGVLFEGRRTVVLVQTTNSLEKWARIRYQMRARVSALKKYHPLWGRSVTVFALDSSPYPWEVEGIKAIESRHRDVIVTWPVGGGRKWRKLEDRLLHLSH